ncbi:MAG: cation:proton antiporter [Thermodesulfobacteriota bacterium]|nr:MAG: cation:proton antiporter [Thermodesulfobacteriota bacterium]
MTETQIGALLLCLAILFGAAYLLSALLARVRIPAILAALFVAMAAHYTPLNGLLLGGPLAGSFSFLAQLGVLFLLFYIGLQIDLKEMRGLSVDIIWCTALNTVVPFLLGTAVMLGLGYGWLIAFVIGVTRMPTAEAVIVPILDEFQLIRTRVGGFIVGAGVLDDVIEVFLIAFVSVWIGERATSAVAGSFVESEVLGILASIIIFLVMAWLFYRWLAPVLGRLLPRRPHNLIMLAMLILLGFGGFSEYAGLGSVVGAIIAGVVMRPVFNSMALVGEQATQTVQSMSYGFFGPVFFFWVGLSVDLEGMFKAPVLVILLFLAAFFGKLIGVFIMVPMKRITVREAWTIGVGLNARLTTGIIVAQLLLDAKIIDVHLFTAIVAAASFSTVAVPLLFTVIGRRWGEELRRQV